MLLASDIHNTSWSILTSRCCFPLHSSQEIEVAPPDRNDALESIISNVELPIMRYFLRGESKIWIMRRLGRHGMVENEVGLSGGG